MRATAKGSSGASHASPNDIDLMEVAGSLRQKLPRLLATSLLVGLGTFGIVSLMTPTYTSQAQIEVLSAGISSPYDPKNAPASNADVTVRMDREAIGTHVRGLMSSDLALRLTKDLKLQEQPDFNSALPPKGLLEGFLRMVGIGGPKSSQSEQDRVLEAYYKAVRAYQIRETRGIIIESVTSEPRLSADVANRLAEIYRDSLAGNIVTENEDAWKRLLPQIEKLTKEVAQADAAVIKFRGEKDIIVGGPNRTPLNEQQLAELTAELSKATTARSEVEARANAAKEMLQRGTAEASPDVQKSQLIPRLIEQRVRLERQISELSAALLPAHPRMKQLQADLAGLNTQIKSEIRKVVDSIEKELKVAVDREANVKRRIDDLKRQVVGRGGDSVKLAELEALQKSKRDELERLQRQAEAAKTTTESRAVPTEVRIVSRALPSSEKSSLKASFAAPFAMLLTFFLGALGVVTKALAFGARSGGSTSETPPAPPSRRLRVEGTSETVQAAAATAETIEPSLPTPAPTFGRQAAETPAADVAETPMARVAEDLIARTEGISGHRLLLTAASRAARPAVVEAIDLARHLQGAGRQVLLVDWLSRTGGLAGELKLAASPGLADILAGRAEFEDAVHQLDNSGLQVILAGEAIGPGPDADAANMMLDALDQAYDHVVVYAGYEQARGLFQLIEGRFDTGILVQDRPGKRGDDDTGFLGFEVRDLDIVRCVGGSAPVNRARSPRERETELRV
jgi:uncharacterized protein involved in exopolysaccharide biosynthesis